MLFVICAVMQNKNKIKPIYITILYVLRKFSYRINNFSGEMKNLTIYIGAIFLSI